jgi:signal transduction histidine kinase
MVLREVLATVPDLVLVVNPLRQVIFANRAVLELVDRTEEDIRGLRPGELVGCIHSETMPGGCGTSEACQTCGAVAAILAAADGREAEREARLTLMSGASVDLRVKAQGIRVKGEELTVVALSDIASEKRKRALERIFFHDVLNTAGGVQGLARLLEGASQDQVDKLVDMLQSSADQLVDEILAQRMLTSAEDDDYVLSLGRYPIDEIVRDTVGTYVSLGYARDVGVEVDGALPDKGIETDHTMLLRVLGNLTKNAIEASRPGMKVRVSGRIADEGAEFTVHSEPMIPRAGQLQVFQRSFTTKGPGRGLGTYSAKLFAEQYLGGQISFTTSEEEGTTFRVVLPITLR